MMKNNKNYVANQIIKAIKKNNGVMPKYVDIYNAIPKNNEICITLTTYSGSWSGCGSLAVIMKEREIYVKNKKINAVRVL